MVQILRLRTDGIGPFVLWFASALLVGLPATGGEANPPDRLPLQEESLFYTESGKVWFTSSVPLHTFTGHSRHLTGMIDLEENVVDFYVDLETLETGINRRDRDMQRTLDIDEFPFAEFTGSLTNRADPAGEEPLSVTAEGTFTIHGVSRPVRIDGTLSRNGPSLHLEAEWSLRLSDYDIEPPGILFYRVQETQELRIETTLNAVDQIP